MKFMCLIKKKIDNKNGFTLVELLIVIAVLGIITGIGITSMASVIDTFKERADEKTAEQIARNVEILVLAGEITANGKVEDEIEFPSSQTNGTEFEAEVVFSNDKKTCEVIVTAGNNFSHKVSIHSKKIE